MLIVSVQLLKNTCGIRLRVSEAISFAGTRVAALGDDGERGVAEGKCRAWAALQSGAIIRDRGRRRAVSGIPALVDRDARSGSRAGSLLHRPGHRFWPGANQLRVDNQAGPAAPNSKCHRANWRFSSSAYAGCSSHDRRRAAEVTLSVNVKLRSRLMQAIAEQVMRDAASDIMLAFEARARELYGPTPTR